MDSATRAFARTTTRRSNRRGGRRGGRPSVRRQVLLALATILAAALTTVPTSSVVADTAPANPADPRTPVTVSADGLPTAQINGVGWEQTIIGNTVYVAGRFSKARPAGAAPGKNEVTR